MGFLLLSNDKGQTNSFVGFYDETNYVPVSQEDTGSEIHELRRKRLFVSLGVPPIAIRDSRVLEIGPGGGANAEILLRMNPKCLTLLDGSSVAIAELKARFMASNVKIIEGDFSSNIPNETFDIIIAEGCIPGQKKPEKVLSKISQHVSIDGHLIFTTQTSVSLLPEILRRIIAKVILEDFDATFDDRVDLLVKFFKPSLESLVGMSRPHRDWVVDVLIHPWEIGSHIFTADQALNAIGDNFDVIGSRPEIFLDQSWYKQDLEGFSNKTTGFKKMNKTSTSFLIDYRLDKSNSSELSFHDAEALDVACSTIYKIHEKFNPNSESDIEDLISGLRNISELIQNSFPQTFISLIDFITNFPKLLEKPEVQAFDTFHHWFGRGQQYLSVIRKK
jgi:2-polyprenyl-3-methyl-5-hydroxy-6-metoxy-1,4-benzoquinol methylase